MEDDFDYFIVPDFRYLNEFSVINSEFTDKVITIKIERPNFDNGLTELQKQHTSETSLNDFVFDYLIYNDGTLKNLNTKVDKFINDFLL